MSTRLATLALFACTAVLGACAGSGLHTAGPVSAPTQNSATDPAAASSRAGSLKVLTLNLAHGRGRGRHQLFQSTDTIRANLVKTAEVLRRHAPDVVAFQEADGLSFWSGDFDHVSYLANKGGFDYVVHGEHVEGPGLSYGTALVSRLRPRDPVTITFDTDLSAFPKGFVVATVQWPGAPSIGVDVVSLHLDFLGEAARRAQAAELIAVLKERGYPVIVMGDFNSQWQEPDSAVRLVAEELRLTAFDATGADLATFPKFDRRLDWILVSRGLEFLAYETLPDVLSDHRGVVAEIVLSRAEMHSGSDPAP